MIWRTGSEHSEPYLRKRSGNLVLAWWWWWWSRVERQAAKGKGHSSGVGLIRSTYSNTKILTSPQTIIFFPDLPFFSESL